MEILSSGLGFLGGFLLKPAYADSERVEAKGQGLAEMRA